MWPPRLESLPGLNFVLKKKKKKAKLCVAVNCSHLST